MQGKEGTKHKENGRERHNQSPWANMQGERGKSTLGPGLTCSTVKSLRGLTHMLYASLILVCAKLLAYLVFDGCHRFWLVNMKFACLNEALLNSSFLETSTPLSFTNP